jgi:N-acetyl-anhydromuramyl-L-alanine amidase AmpD
MSEAQPAERSAWIAAGLCLALVVAAAALAWWRLRPEVEPGPPTWEQLAPPADVQMHAWKHLVIHHSAADAGSTASIDREHHDRRGWDGVGYHFVIGNGHGMPVGRVEGTFRWRAQATGAHAGAAERQKAYNQDGIGVCLIGDFTRAEPGDRQFRRLVELCALLIERVPTLGLGAIVAHRQIRQTDCPGQLDIDRLRYAVRLELERRGVRTR